MNEKTLKIKGWLLDIGLSMIGTAMVAAGLLIFTIPNNLAPGGVSGLATAISSVTGISVGTLTLLFNIPLILIALKLFGLKPLLRTLIATLLLSAFIELLEPYLFTYTNDILLASVFGGVAMGAGMGLLFMRGITTGGTDLVAIILRRLLPHLQMGNLLVMIDALVVVVAVIIFKNIEIALYSAVTIFCSGKVIDAMMQGMDFAKVLMIVTEQGELVTQVVMKVTGHGVTNLVSKGGYTKKEKQTLVCVMRRNEVSKTLRAIKSVDPKAFTIIYNATEVHGEGFKEEM